LSNIEIILKETGFIFVEAVAAGGCSKQCDEPFSGSKKDGEVLEKQSLQVGRENSGLRIFF